MDPVTRQKIVAIVGLGVFAVAMVGVVVGVGAATGHVSIGSVISVAIIGAFFLTRTARDVLSGRDQQPRDPVKRAQQRRVGLMLAAVSLVVMVLIVVVSVAAR